MKKRLPVGIDSFEKIRSGNYYYVDKTVLIEQVLEKGSEVTLFTRPRRFGKSLNMSMLQRFFEIGTDPGLFGGAYRAKHRVMRTAYGKISGGCNQFKRCGCRFLFRNV